MGFDRDGAYAEYVAVPSANLYPLPDNVSYDQAAAVTELARAAGYRERGLTRDLAGHDRVLCFDRPEGLLSGHRDA